MSLEAWFEGNKRDFPWRVNRTPYRVWISEVMLQQTRAKVVVPYFLRWMEKFPDVKALYMASSDEVIKAWEGLGFYSRARNLHRAAKQIVEEFGGRIPDTKEDLQKIHGFGPYTTGAVLAFAFRQREPAIDGNVMRVLSRYFRIEENIAKASIRKKIEEKAKSLLDSKRPWVSVEALIELGATVCTPKPQCEKCPLNKKCLGKEIAQNLPVKNQQDPIISLVRKVLVLEHDKCFLVKKGAKGKVMADLYEFPYVETSEISSTRALEYVHAKFGKGSFKQRLSQLSHTFTKYKAHLHPFWIEMGKKQNIPEHEWIHFSKLSKYPFSSGHRKILTEVRKSYRMLA